MFSLVCVLSLESETTPPLLEYCNASLPVWTHLLSLHFLLSPLPLLLSLFSFFYLPSFSFFLNLHHSFSIPVQGFFSILSCHFLIFFPPPPLSVPPPSHSVFFSTILQSSFEIFPLNIKKNVTNPFLDKEKSVKF